jgi:micrococcal nuclease
MSLFTYKAQVASVHDGDTVTLDVDLGFGITKRETFRLARINAPELFGPSKAEGIAARDFLISQLPAFKAMTIKTLKSSKGSDSQEKYGRYLVELIGQVPDQSTDQTLNSSINDLMVTTGHAIYQTY